MTDIFPDCNQISIFMKHFYESFRYKKKLCKSVRWETRWCMPMEG